MATTVSRCSSHSSVAIHLYHTAGSRSQCIPVRSRVATLVYPQKSSSLSGSYCPRTPHTSFDQTIPPLLQHFHLQSNEKLRLTFVVQLLTVQRSSAGNFNWAAKGTTSPSSKATPATQWGGKPNNILTSFPPFPDLAKVVSLYFLYIELSLNLNYNLHRNKV